MDIKKLSRRERENLMHREEILTAALKLFSENGYHNVSMHEIAQKSEFAIGTLYKFFKNKEDLYKALIMTKAEEYHRILKDVLGQEDDVLTALKKYIAAKARIFAESVPTLRLYFAETRGASFNIKAGLDQDIRKLYDQVIELLASVFEKGVAKKVFRKLDPYYMAVALEGITNAFLFCWLEDPSRHPYDANVPMIADMFLNGVLIK
ncbi:MAG: TetR/AcrR family transcriptional regulator [Desulfobacterales bacterium]|nr:TetR/AcrR family transcriptional regulator [Desulfobacterales bacterium]